MLPFAAGKAPLVTVYVPCRNYGRFLGKALDSLKKQLYGNWELFVIDEASTDETEVIARHFQGTVTQKVEVIRNAAPQGLQHVANRVLGMASGRYIIRLDADDWLEESALLLMVAKLESSAEIGLVYGNYYYTDEPGNILGFERRHKLGVEDTSSHLPPHGACTMVRASLLKAVGGYSEDINAQDGWELWLKLLQRTRAASLEAPVFYYRQHGNSLSRDSGRLLEARAKIFAKLRKRQEGGYKPSCLAVIPVRESYPSFERVPYRLVNGKSLLQIALESAQQAANVTEVVVTSDSQAVLDFSEQLVANKQVEHHLRLKRGGEPVGALIRPRDIMLDACERHFAVHQHYPDIVLFLSIHALFRRAEHIDTAVNKLLIQRSDSVVSVCEEREPMFAHGGDGLKLLNPGRFDGLSYERERIYSFNGAIIACWLETLRDGHLFGEAIDYIEMDLSSSRQIKSAAGFGADGTVTT